MMNLRHLIPVLLILVGCGPPEPVDLNELLVQGETYLDPTTMEPYSGPVFSLHEGTNDLSRRGNLVDGLFDGPSETYHENGQLFSKGSYSNGEMDGPFERYYSNGQLSRKGTYSNGELEGPYERYYDNGQLMLKGSYSNGELDGPSERYYRNGQLFWKGSYSNGERCGEWYEMGSIETYPPCPTG